VPNRLSRGKNNGQSPDSGAEGPKRRRVLKVMGRTVATSASAIFLVVLIAAVLALVMTRSADAADITVASPGAFKQVLNALAPQFEQETGDKLTVSFQTVGQHLSGAVAQRALDEHGPGRHRVGVPGGQVVEHRDLMPGRHELRGDDAADVSGTAGDDDLHRR